MNQKIPHWSILLWFSPTPPPKSLLLVSTERNEEMGQVPRCSLKGSLVQVEFFWQARKFWLRWEIISKETCCLLHFHCFACTFHLTVYMPFSCCLWVSTEKKLSLLRQCYRWDPWILLHSLDYKKCFSSLLSLHSPLRVGRCTMYLLFPCYLCCSSLMTLHLFELVG